jgi:hypothetical protein
MELVLTALEANRDMAKVVDVIERGAVEMFLPGPG